MSEDDVCGVVIGCGIRIHQRLGPGLFESVYEELLAADLMRLGLRVESQKKIDFEFEGLKFERGFRIDLLVADCVIVELKSVEQTARVHAKQLLTYLRLTDLRVGLILNFGQSTLREGITRLVNNYSAPQ